MLAVLHRDVGSGGHDGQLPFDGGGPEPSPLYYVICPMHNRLIKNVDGVFSRGMINHSPEPHSRCVYMQNTYNRTHRVEFSGIGMHGVGQNN